MSRSRSFRFAPHQLASVLATVLVLVVGLAAPAAAEPPAVTPEPDGPASLEPLDATQALNPAPELIAQFTPGRYVVVLGAAPTAAARPLLDAARTAAPSADELHAKQEEVAQAVGATILQKLSVATNGFSADLSAEQAARLTLDPRVVQVVPDELLPLAQTGTQFLGLEGPDGVWSRLGGTAGLGDGVVVGVIDTGIAPENPSFTGEPLATTGDGSEPYRDGDSIVFDKSDGGIFHGVCESGTGFTPDDCTTKLVGARYFVDGFGGFGAIGGAAEGEYPSPRDGAGHGSHTASTAAGNYGVQAEGVTISGVTPAARIAAYKACWTGPYNWATFDDGCALSDLLAAVDAATADGVDVINFSIGGGSAVTTASVLDQAFLVAASAGIFVAAAGGNSGPEASTVDNASPWITTVAASTIAADVATVELGDGERFLGAPSALTGAAISAPLVLAESIPAPGTDAYAAGLCLPSSLDNEKVAGAIVICDRGNNARVDKSAVVAAAGGVGMILVNPTPDSLDIDLHSVPTIHLDAAAREALRAYAQSPDAQASLVSGNPADLPTPPAPQIAGFSSRGPVLAGGSDVLKPDVAAPGVAILAALASADGSEPEFGYLSGTSMASPHVAGLGALYLSQHPTASPSEIKSSLMTTASDLLDDQGQPTQDVFAQGAGQVEARSFLDPGLLYLNGTEDWLDYLGAVGVLAGRNPVDASDLNIASIAIGALAGPQTVTRTVTSTGPGSYSVDVSGLDGIDVKVEPASLEFAAAGEQQEFTVTFTPVDAPVDQFVTGELTWVNNGGGTDVRSPVAVMPIPFAAPRSVEGVGATGSVTIDTVLGESSELDVATAGLSRGTRNQGEGLPGGEPQRFGLTLDSPADLLLIDLRSTDGQRPLDLRVLGFNDDGSVYPIGAAPVARSSHRAVLPNPEPATYVIEVVFPQDGTTSPLGYQLTSYVLGGDVPQHPFTVDPDVIRGGTGDRIPVTASWADLPAGPYLASLSYGETGVQTLLTVDAGTAPAQPGTPTLTVTPGAEEWVMVGDMVHLSADGLTAGLRYEARIDGAEPVRSGEATEDGQLDWLLRLSADVAPGAHTLEVTGPDASLAAAFQVTTGRVTGGAAAFDPSFDGSVSATYTAYVMGSGDVRVRVAEAESGRVVFDGLTSNTTDPLVRTTAAFPVTPGVPLTATANVVLPGDAVGPTFDYEVQDVPQNRPSTVEVASVDDRGSATVNVNNQLQYAEEVAVVYQACDGTRVIGYDSFVPGESTHEWDLAGYVSVQVLVDGDVSVFDHQNSGSSRCAVRADDVRGQDLWIQLVDPATTSDPADDDSVTPDRPIAGTVSYRYEPGIDEFGLTVRQEPVGGATLFPGTGEDPWVAVEPVTERGAIWSTDIAVAEGLPTWLDLTFYETEPVDVFGWFAMEAPPVTLADLQPQAEPTVDVAQRFVQAGGTITVDLTGLTPGQETSITLERVWVSQLLSRRLGPREVVVATVVPDATGAARMTVPVPLHTRTGVYRLTAGDAASARFVVARLSRD